MVVLITILLIILLLSGWLLLAPLQIKVNTQDAKVNLRWVSIGSANLWYDDEWWLSIKSPFYKKTIPLSRTAVRKKQGEAEKKKKERSSKRKTLNTFIKIIKTFRVTEWQCALDTGDYCTNARLYPLNFLPFASGHLYVNFRDKNFLLLTLCNRPWKILYAFLR